jgi:hypothetical protein
MDGARRELRLVLALFGKIRGRVLIGLFSLVAQFLYWSKIVGELNEQQAER